MGFLKVPLGSSAICKSPLSDLDPSSKYFWITFCFARLCWIVPSKGLLIGFESILDKKKKINVFRFISAVGDSFRIAFDLCKASCGIWIHLKKCFQTAF